MTLSVIPKTLALSRIAHSLQVRVRETANAPTLQMVAQALRRAAHILAPCPRHELERAVAHSLKELGSEAEELSLRTEEALESLLAYGELLEMQTPVDDPWDTSPFVLRPAPPAFVFRKNGSAIILGVAGDEITPLTGDMNERLQDHGVLRSLVADQGENLRAFLTDLGLIELSEKTWLRLPPVESATSFLASWHRRLSEAASVSAIEGLRILDTRKLSSYYAGRWSDPNRSYSPR